eukprot:15479725-Alexandrium_andersonii.AAC.1
MDPGGLSSGSNSDGYGRFPTIRLALLRAQHFAIPRTGMRAERAVRTARGSSSLRALLAVAGRDAGGTA